MNTATAQAAAWIVFVDANRAHREAALRVVLTQEMERVLTKVLDLCDAGNVAAVQAAVAVEAPAFERFIVQAGTLLAGEMPPPAVRSLLTKLHTIAAASRPAPDPQVAAIIRARDAITKQQDAEVMAKIREHSAATERANRAHLMAALQPAPTPRLDRK